MDIIIEWVYEIVVDAGMRTTELIYENQQFHRRRWIGSLVYGGIWVLLTSVLLSGTMWLMRYLLDFNWMVWLVVAVGIGLTYWTGQHARQWLQTYLWVMHHRTVPQGITLSGYRMKHANNKKH